MSDPVQHPLTAILAAQGRSARWLAGRTGVSPAMITRIVQGTRTPTDDFKRRTAEALGVPAALIFPAPTQAVEPQAQAS